MPHLPMLDVLHRQNRPTQFEAAAQQILQEIVLLEELGLSPFCRMSFIFQREAYAARAGLKRIWNT